MPDIAELLPVHESLIFGAVRVEPDILLSQSDLPQIEIGHGFNSTAYRVGEYVMKVGKQAKSYQDALGLARTMNSEYSLLREHLGDSLPPTTLWVAGEPSSGDNKVITLQPFIPGITLAEHVANPETDNYHVLDFLSQNLRMYQKTRKIADLANIEGGFRVLKTGNLVIGKEGEPTLVDTNFGKAQRSRALGPIFSNQIARGVNRGIQKIRNLA